MDMSATSRFAHWRHATAKALVYALCAAIAVPAWPASTLVQVPPFTATEPPGNVFLLLDDSASMGNHALPMPTGITIDASAGTTVTIQGDGADASGNWALRSWVVNRDFDWKLRAPALNPLWYNPAVRYEPWSRDGVALPAASIGGSTPATHHGAFTSRPDPARLTERDPRQVPVGTSYVSVTTAAGRGLIGTDPWDPTSNLLLGRRVNAAVPSVDFRYYKMPFDFGPTKAGATSAPGNGHASLSWTTHHDTNSPLDLFSRPLTSIPATTRNGCFTGSAQCLSGVPPAVPLVTTTWQRTDCSGVTQVFTADPGPLTCHRARCGWSGGWSAWSPTPVTLTCGYQWTDCSGTVRNSPTNPGPVSCGWRRADCSGNVVSFDTNPGNLTCYRTRPCSSAGYGSWTPTNPGTLATCYQRSTCTGGTQYFSGTDPGTLTCGFTRQNCSGTTESFATNPGNLTCYRRDNCDGSVTGPGTTPLSSVICTSAGELPFTINPTSFTRTPWSAGTISPTVRSLIETTTRSPIAPSTGTPTLLTQQNESESRPTNRTDVSSCPSGTSQLSCTITAPANVPDPAALTPARYYTYTGTGSKGDPANYRVVQIDRTRPSTHLYRVVDATTGAQISAADSQRSDCAANGKTHCTWVEEAQNFANWYLYYRNRLFASQAVMAEAMSGMTTPQQQLLRVGYGRINYFDGAINPWRTVPLESIGALPAVDGFPNPGALVRGVRSFIGGTPARTAFFDWLFSLSWVGATPNREALDSVGRYFSWTDDRGPWGATPGSADTSPQLACRRNSAFLATDGEWTNVASGQPLISASGPLGGVGSPVEADNVAGPPIQGDGNNAAASFTYAPGLWPQFTGGANQSGTLTDVATYYWNRDLRPDLLNVLRPITDSANPNPAFWQSMSTYIVGFGLSASMDTPATRTAVQAGTALSWPTVDLGNTVITGGNRVNDNLRAALASRGDFYAARDTAALKAGIQSAFSAALAQQGSAGGVAVTGAGITGSSQAYFPSYTTGKWTGSLRAYSSADLEALAQGTAVTPAWSATVPAPASRNVLTSTARNSATTFQSGNLSAAQATALTSTDHTATEAVNYLRGDTSQELSITASDAGRRFRARESVLGDFVNSTPLYVKAPDHGYGSMPSIGASYRTFVDNRRAGTAAGVYIGGNAGMFHGFDASTGVERFAYVPRGVYADLPRLLDPGYAHRYYVDGPVTGGDYHDGSAWRSVVVGTTGAGGASIFAIDVTNPASVGPSSVKWDITDTDNNDVGHVLTRGVIGRIKTGPTSHRWVYITGNGYESVNNRAALLVIDIHTGSLTTIPVGPTWTATMGLAARNGMGGVTVSYDPQRNIKGVYAGDRQGNLWRFDFSNGVPTGAKGFDGSNAALFTAIGPAAKRRPISAAPRLALHPRGGFYVIFGTGKLHDDGDAANVDSQAIYGIWEKPDHAAAITTAQVATVPMSTAADDTRSFSLSGVDWNTRLGWSVTLTGGERIISDPGSDLGTMSIASFTPTGSGDPCVGGGTSYLYRFDYTTGEVRGTPAGGVVGAITPLVALPSGTRLQSSINLTDTMRAPGPGVSGGGSESAAQCRLYSTSIQGRPNVIAQNCPGMAPMRVWRQPTR